MYKSSDAIYRFIFFAALCIIFGIGLGITIFFPELTRLLKIFLGLSGGTYLGVIIRPVIEFLFSEGPIPGLGDDVGYNIKTIFKCQLAGFGVGVAIVALLKFIGFIRI
jgi:hypothetical protein